MKRKIIIFFILALAIIGISVWGYFKATPGINNKIPDYPQIEVSPKSYDFGEIEFGTLAQYTFKARNSGNQALEIKRLATSCACTTAKINKEVINPNEEVEILVTYDTKVMGEGPHAQGKQERIIYIKTNDPINPHVEVMIYAYVK